MKKLISMLLIVCMMAAALSGCSGSGSGSAAPEGKGTAQSSADTASDKDGAAQTKETMQAQTAADNIAESVQQAGGGEGHSVGFVTFGLGGDFFQQLADAFVAKMTEAGWVAQYADGAFDPTTQIEAFENYIAMNMDVIVVWSVAPEAMESVIETAMSKGIKVVAFVAPTTKYDVLMVSDDAELADSCAKMAAKWIDEKFADAQDHSIPVAVLTCRVADTGVVQGDELLKIEQFSQKAKFVTEVQLEAEDVATGMKAAENLYTTNPEIQVFLSAHNGLAMGVNNYFTAISSPITDYSDMGIFTINGDNAVAEAIEASKNDETPLRGMVLTGSVNDTALEIQSACLGIMDGSLEAGSVMKAATTFVTPDTAADYIATGKTKLTEDDFK